MRTEPGPRPRLDRDLIVHGLEPLGLRVLLVEETASTNLLAAEQARSGAPHGLVVIAEHQSAGRGRLDRSWSTPRGTAAVFSLVLRPGAPPAAWPWLPLLAGHAVAAALRGAGLGAGVKWPNDVLVEERKICGILLERIETPTGPAAVVGVGLNVGLAADDLPTPQATSVELATGRPADRSELLVAMPGALWAAYGDWCAPGGDARLSHRVTERCVTLGRRVRVALPDGSDLHGLATSVDASGRLVVRTDAGREVALSAGDVVHVRAQPDREAGAAPGLS